MYQTVIYQCGTGDSLTNNIRDWDPTLNSCSVLETPALKISLKA